MSTSKMPTSPIHTPTMSSPIMFTSAIPIPTFTTSEVHTPAMLTPAMLTPAMPFTVMPISCLHPLLKCLGEQLKNHLKENEKKNLINNLKNLKTA